MVKYQVDLNFGFNIFKILNQKIPMYYSMINQIKKLSSKNKSVNIIYQN